VRQFLISEHGIDPKRLAAKGYGKSQLLLPSDPNNELNRRVQFQNRNYATASVPAAGAPAAAVPAATPATVAPAAAGSANGPIAPTARPALPTPAASTGQGEGLWDKRSLLFERERADQVEFVQRCGRCSDRLYLAGHASA
jgi:hypothetical protein